MRQKFFHTLLSFFHALLSFFHALLPYSSFILSYSSSIVLPCYFPSNDSSEHNSKWWWWQVCVILFNERKSRSLLGSLSLSLVTLFPHHHLHVWSSECVLFNIMNHKPLNTYFKVKLRVMGTILNEFAMKVGSEREKEWARERKSERGMRRGRRRMEM